MAVQVGMQGPHCLCSRSSVIPVHWHTTEYTHESQGLPGVCVAMREVEDSPSSLLHRTGGRRVSGAEEGEVWE